MAFDMIDCQLLFELFSIKWKIYSCFLSPRKYDIMKIDKKGFEKYYSEIAEFIRYLP